VAKVCLACKHQFEEVDWTCPRCGAAPETQDGLINFAPGLAQELDSFEASFFERLAQSESGHFWFEARNDVIVWALQKYFADAGNLLEVGCGTAFVLSAIRKAQPQLQLSGSELFTEGLKFARKRLPGATLYQMDADNIPFEAEFDIIAAFDVIEHIADDESVLSSCFKAIRPGGGLVVTVPQHPFLWSVADEYSHHKRRYTRKELRKRLERAGFAIVHMTSFISLFLPVMALSRWRHPKSSIAWDPMSEFRINSSLNSLLRNVLRMEQLVIQSGVSLPIGGSLLAVARRPLPRDIL